MMHFYKKYCLLTRKNSMSISTTYIHVQQTKKVCFVFSNGGDKEFWTIWCNVICYSSSPMNPFEQSLKGPKCLKRLGNLERLLQLKSTTLLVKVYNMFYLLSMRRANVFLGDASSPPPFTRVHAENLSWTRQHNSLQEPFIFNPFQALTLYFSSIKGYPLNVLAHLVEFK